MFSLLSNISRDTDLTHESSTRIHHFKWLNSHQENDRDIDLLLSNATDDLFFLLSGYRYFASFFFFSSLFSSLPSPLLLFFSVCLLCFIDVSPLSSSSGHLTSNVAAATTTSTFLSRSLYLTLQLFLDWTFDGCLFMAIDFSFSLKDTCTVF